MSADSTVSVWHVKAEVKSEIHELSEAGDSDTSIANTVVEDSEQLNIQNMIVTQCRGRGRGGGRSRGRRGRQRGGLQRGGSRGALQKSCKFLQANNGKMHQSMDYQNSATYIMSGLQTETAQPKLTNILPKTDDSNGKGNGYSQTDIMNFLRSLEITNTTNTAPTANLVLPSTFTVNSLPGTGSSLTGPDVSTLPFSPFILSNNILSNTQQDTRFLGGSAQLINPLPSTNTIQTGSLVSGFQTLNMTQPLSNFPSLSIAPNQNSSLSLQNIAPVFNPGTQSSAIFTGNINQTVSSVVASTMSPSYKVPVLIGNQIILMDMPAQYPPGVSLASTPTTGGLPSFRQPLGLFSSAVTPTANTQQTTAHVISTALPCSSLSATSLQPQPDVAATSFNITPHLQPHPRMADTTGGQETRENTKRLKSPPPLILAKSLNSQHQPQEEPKLFTASNEALCSEKITSSRVSAKCKSLPVQNGKHKRKVADTMNPTGATSLILQLQCKDGGSLADNNKEIYCDSSVSDAQKNTLNSELSVDPLINLAAGGEPKKPCMASVVNKYSQNSKEPSFTISTASEMSAYLKATPHLETKKLNVRSLQMETPDSIGGKMFPSGKEKKKQSLIMKCPIISDYTGVGKQPKAVQTTLENKTSTENKTAASIQQVVNHRFNASRKPLILKLRPKSKKQSTRLPLMMSPETIKELVVRVVQPLSNPADVSRELLPKQTVNNCHSNSSVDDDDESMAHSDVICKISEVKSMADILPQSSPVLLKNKECHDLNQQSDDLNSVQGTLFVGPFTKEQLDLIIQNPLELDKYVSVPSGHVPSSKLIVVPAASSSVTVAAPKGMVPTFTASSYTPPSYPESHFVKIFPKPACLPSSCAAKSTSNVSLPSSSATTTTTTSTVCLPSSSATTTTTTSTARLPSFSASTTAATSTETSSPQTVVPVTSFSSSSVVPKAEVNNLATPSNEKNGNKKRKVSGKKAKVKPSRGSKKIYQDEEETSSQKLECNTTKDSQNSNIIKLCFNGDLNLLKDALRKTTVELEKLDSRFIFNTVCYPKRIKKDSSPRETSDSRDDSYKPKCRKRGLCSNEQTNIVLTRSKEKELMENRHKRWVPLEVVGDLAIRGSLLESGESESRSVRRSNRISAKPRLDYADLESLPFHDNEELDCELDTLPPSPHSQSSPSPPPLTPILDQVHNQGMFADITRVEAVDMEAQNTDDTNPCFLQPEVTTCPVLKLQGTAHPVLQSEVTAHPVLQYAVTAHPVMQSEDTAHPVLQSEVTAHPVLQSEVTAHPVLQSEVTAHPVLQSEVTAHPVRQSEDTAHPMLQSEVTAHPVLQSEVTAHPVLQSEVTTHPVLQSAVTAHPVMQSEDTAHPMLQSEVTAHPVLQSEVTAHPVLQSEVTAHPVLQSEDTAHPMLQSEVTAHPVLQSEVTAYPVLQSEVTAHPVLQSEVTAHPVLQSEVTAHPVLQSEVTAHPVLQSEDTTHSVLYSQSIIHSVLQSQGTTNPRQLQDTISSVQHQYTTHPVLKPQDATDPVLQPQDTTYPIPKPQDITHPVPQPQEITHPVPQPQDITRLIPQPLNITCPVLQPHDTTCPVLQPQDITHPVPQSQDITHPVPHSQEITHPVLQSEVITHSVIQPHDTTHPIPQSQDTSRSVLQPLNTIHPLPEPHRIINHSSPQSVDTTHLVPQPQIVTAIDDIDSLSQADGPEDCYYSSESESDMFDTCDKSLSEVDKKKVMWKRHSEITIFLVKHADRFHSDDDKGEHYCNICRRYKTNGVFHLSLHLKKHLGGALRCSQCDFEACHELNLGEHRKTRHSL